ncbi:MAG: response regulator, partial [Actinomycetia bacterium]|nr:response regulator [Actinomycetes bacterium]
MNKKIKVLIVDDSALMRKILSDILNSDPDIEVVGIAQTGKIALHKINSLDPDIVTLDIVMPGMDGIETLKKIMLESPRPVVMISSVAKKDAELTLKALNFGAVDFLTKPGNILSSKFSEMKDEIIMKVKTAAEAHISKLDIKELEDEEEHLEQIRKEFHKTEITDGKLTKIVTIGISTGGPQALKSVLPKFEKDIDFGILIVQHMPENFTNAFAERMNMLSKIFVTEAKDGDRLTNGKAIIARGDY